MMGLSVIKIVFVVGSEIESFSPIPTCCCFELLRVEQPLSQSGGTDCNIYEPTPAVMLLRSRHQPLLVDVTVAVVSAIAKDPLHASTTLSLLDERQKGGNGRGSFVEVL